METKHRKSETCFKGNKLKSSDGKQKKGTSKSECAILSKKRVNVQRYLCSMLAAQQGQGTLPGATIWNSTA
jgi:hypothetical protein